MPYTTFSQRNASLHIDVVKFYFGRLSIISKTLTSLVCTLHMPQFRMHHIQSSIFPVTDPEHPSGSSLCMGHVSNIKSFILASIAVLFPPNFALLYSVNDVLIKIMRSLFNHKVDKYLKLSVIRKQLR